MVILLALLAGCEGTEVRQVAQAQPVRGTAARVPSRPSALVPLQGAASCWAGRGGPNPQPVCLEPVARGFERPVWAGGIPGGATWVLEQEGRIRQVGLEAPILDLTDVVSDRSPEEGLLGLAMHPRFPEDPRVFLYWSAAKPRRSVVASFRASASGLDRDSQQVVLEVAQPYGNHNGGHLVFGPEGYLYVGLGDGGAGGDPKGHGQRPDTLLGSILRLDVDSATPYAIPPDNPFVGSEEGRPEVWAWGLRNPWRFAFDPVTGWLWAGDVGQNKYEEVHIVRGGGNHGWNSWEGRHCFKSETCDATGLVPALWDYGRDLGQSITGGVVYRGRVLPELTGAFLAADFVSGRIWALCSDGSTLLGEALLADTDANISHIGIGATGEPLVVGYAGSLNRLVPRSGRACP